MGDSAPAEDDLPAGMSKSHISQSYSNSSIFAEDHCSEEFHQELLDAALVEHTRVRDTALRVFHLHELREEALRIHQAAAQEEERVRIETEKVKEEIRLRELRATHVKAPTPPPQPPTPPAPSPPPAAQPTSPKKVTAPCQSPQEVAGGTQQPQLPAQSAPTVLATQSNGLGSLSRPAQLIQQPVALPAVQPPVPTQPALKPAAPKSTRPDTSFVFESADQYVNIHLKLKELRKHLGEAVKQDPALKKKLGEMRREIRRSVGQLTEGRGANKVPMAKITENLKEALTTVQSPLMDVSMVTLLRPEPKETALNNGDQLPMLFIYLLNIFSKAIVSQFIDEAGVSTKAADPIGVSAVSIFSKPEFLWRGQSLIAILIAKMRVVCPVLFGIRGNEKTEEGRARLGWKRNEGQWVGEQEHNTRMTGLGAGYAALSLRDYSKTKLTNPYPPSFYWQTMASIVSTPPDQTSSTQYMVLKALVDGYEQRFMNFYGSAARAALQVALVDFPNKAVDKNAAVGSLKVLADKLGRDMGLHLQNTTMGW